MHDLRVFWPQNTASNGTVIGWLHEKVAVIAAVVEDEVCQFVGLCKPSIDTRSKDSVDIERRLAVHEKWLELKEDCERTPIILGVVGRWNEGVVSIRFQDESLNHIK
jgi:hypothetical protein